MVTEITNEDFVARSSDVFSEEEAKLKAAHDLAIAELNRIREKASTEAAALSANGHYSVHTVEGIGKYVIPRRTGWKPLLEVIHDPVPNIDFSANIYPAFDGILGQHFNSPYLLDPLDDKFMSYESLRDNLAAVRNFLMQTYYANTPEGMTPEKAKQALADIAAFVGDGLYNNWRYYGVIPNHNPTQPFIDLDRARKENGKGAQYIYEKILEMQRHSNWMRPFDAVMELFGGKKHHDWKLPPANKTHFREKYGKDLAEGEPDIRATVAATEADIAAMEARLADIRDAKLLSTVAQDLDHIGNHLIYTAEHMEAGGVAHLSAPVRRDAVEIALDILRKLKLSIGNASTLDGLQMKPTDDMAVLGAVKGVATTFERLLAWARGNNDAGILQHPSILAATQAIGQLGYLAKAEALRIATLARNPVLASTIGAQLRSLPEGYAKASDATFGGLLDKIGRGIDTVINRTQQVGVDGAEVGFSRENRLGSTLSAAPTAGSSNQVGADEAARRNAQAATADQLAAMAQAQKLNSQLAAQARTQQAQGQQPSAPPRSSATVGRQALQNARTQQRQTSTSAPAPTTAPLTPAQQMATQRNNAAANAALQAAHLREEQLHHEQQQQQILAQQKAAAAKAAMAKAQAAAKIDPNLLKGFDMKGVTGKPIMPGRAIDPKNVLKPIPKATTPTTAAAPAPSTTPKPAPITAEDDKLKNPYTVQPPTAPNRGGGRGF